MTGFKKWLGACLTSLLIVAAPGEVVAQDTAAPLDGGIALTKLISIVAKQTGKKFVVDPRVRGEVLIVGQDPSNISYADFLTVLQVDGVTAVEGSGFVRIVPDANARQLPVPTISGKETRADAELVSRVLPIKHVPAALLVPILRPLLPQTAHLVALACNNLLLIVDTFGNVKRIEGLVRELDVGEAYEPEKCVSPTAARS